jgi:hypothetical protein
MRSLVAMLLVAAVVSTASAAQTAAKCAAAKQKAAGVKVTSAVKCYGKSIARNTSVDPACLAKADTKFRTTVESCRGGGWVCDDG